MLNSQKSPIPNSGESPLNPAVRKVIFTAYRSGYAMSLNPELILPSANDCNTLRACPKRRALAPAAVVLQVKLVHVIHVLDNCH